MITKAREIEWSDDLEGSISKSELDSILDGVRKSCHKNRIGVRFAKTKRKRHFLIAGSFTCFVLTGLTIIFHLNGLLDLGSLVGKF